LTVRPHKTKVVVEVVTTLSSFRFPELSQSIWSSPNLSESQPKEVDMFARNVSFHLKSNMLADYTRTFDKDILPLLRKQNGFKDEITFSGPGGIDVTAISLWDNKASSDTYNTNTYPEVLKTMARFIEGTPKVQNSEVVNSTFHKIAAGVSA
jgi:hypothetical protein